MSRGHLFLRVKGPLGKLTTPILLKVKIKFSLGQAMKAQRRSRGLAVLFL
jgi:hypothetical protein